MWFTGQTVGSVSNPPVRGIIGQMKTDGTLLDEFQLVNDQTGNSTANSSIVTNLQDTSRLAVGMIVSGSGGSGSGPGIAANITIVSIDSATQITLSGTCGGTSTGATLSFNSQPTGITSDGTNLWFTEAAIDRIGTIRPTKLDNTQTGQAITGLTSINVVSTLGFNPTGTINVQTSTGNVQVMYTGISGNSFTGCTASVSGNLITDGSVAAITEFSIADPSTTLDVTMNGVNLPVGPGTINVASTTGFAIAGTITVQAAHATMLNNTQTGQQISGLSSINVQSTVGFNQTGTINVQTDAGLVQVTYSGTSSTSFSGCTSSGSGLLVASGSVTSVAPVFFTTVTYTGLGSGTPASFTGCLGGAGQLFTGGIVRQASTPTGITFDGTNIWFTEQGTNKIGEISGTSATVSSALWSAGVATFNTTTAHNLTTGQVVAIGGVNPAGYNVTGVVTVTGSTQFTMAIASSPGSYVSGGTVRVIKEFAIPTAGSKPTGITLGPDGNVWFVEFGTNKIGKISSAGAITEVASLTAGSGPFGITTGPDGKLWFTEQTGNKIGQISTGGTVSEFSTGLTASSLPTNMTIGADGNLWFTENKGSTKFIPAKIGEITSSDHTITEWSLPINNTTGAHQPLGITAGPDGNVWFTDAGTSPQIGKVILGGVVTNLDVSTVSTGVIYNGITAATGNLYYSEFDGNNIGQFTPLGVVTNGPVLVTGTVPLPPFGITLGPDGRLWFTEYNASFTALGSGVSRIGRITTGLASPTSFSLTNGSQPFGITPGPVADSDLWFTEYSADRIGVITTATGSITEFSLTDPSTTLDASMNTLSLPQGTINVASTAGFATAGTIRVQASPTTTLAATMNGAILPQGTINVGSTTGFTSSGLLTIQTSTGTALVSYAGKTATAFTGCTGGSGTLATGGAVSQTVLVSYTGITATSFTGCTGGSGTLATGGIVSQAINPADIIFDGTNIWFTEQGTNKIGKMSTAGVLLNEFVIPTAGSQPFGIALGSDGKIWFTELIGDKIGRINVDGTGLVEFSTGLDPSAKPGHMIPGADAAGNLWFCEAAQTPISGLSGVAKMGMITPAGTISEFVIPSGGLPRAITLGPEAPNANIWFITGNKEIGKLVPGFNDNFAGSSGSPLSANWAVVSNPAGPQGTWPAGKFTLNGSNQAVADSSSPPTGTGINIAVVVDGFRSATTAPAAGFTPPSAGNSLTVSADVDISTPATSTGRYGGVVARWGAGSAWNGLVNNVIQTTSAGSGYVGLIYQDSSSSSLFVMLGKMVGNQLILLASPVTLVSPPSESGNVKLQVAGTTLTLTFTPTSGSATVITTTDNSITAGWGAGIVDIGGGSKFSNFKAFDPSLTHIDTFAAPTLATDSSVSSGTPPTGSLTAITLQANVSAALALTSAAGLPPDAYAIRLTSEVFTYFNGAHTTIVYHAPGNSPWESFWKGESKVGGGGGELSVDAADNGETAGDALDKLMTSSL
jgi:streptogramin lyase